jgi:hypothetical protein
LALEARQPYVGDWDARREDPRAQDRADVHAQCSRASRDYARGRAVGLADRRPSTRAPRLTPAAAADLAVGDHRQELDWLAARAAADACVRGTLAVDDHRQEHDRAG